MWDSPMSISGSHWAQKLTYPKFPKKLQINLLALEVIKSKVKLSGMIEALSGLYNFPATEKYCSLKLEEAA